MMKAQRRLRGTAVLFFGFIFLASPSLFQVPALAGADQFGIYVSNLDGSGMRPLLTDPNREINHARVSPDKQWVTFTRYNKRGPHNLAEEGHGYEQSEIMLMRLDGTGLTSLVPPRSGLMAANGYWTPDGTSIVFASNHSDKNVQIYRIDLASRTITKIPLPVDLNLADPHQKGNKLVFTAQEKKPLRNVVWIKELSSDFAHQLTNPPVKQAGGALPPPGDYDPKLSPDGSRVALMRRSGESWQLIVVDLATKTEKNLSSATAVDAVPEWSSDNKKLIFFHIDKHNLPQSGLYTINADGSERRKVPLPKGYLYTMPAFFPGEGSGSQARIIFSAKKVPGL